LNSWCSVQNSVAKINVMITGLLTDNLVSTVCTAKNGWSGIWHSLPFPDEINFICWCLVSDCSNQSVIYIIIIVQYNCTSHWMVQIYTTNCFSYVNSINCKNGWQNKFKKSSDRLTSETSVNLSALLTAVSTFHSTVSYNYW